MTATLWATWFGRGFRAFCQDSCCWGEIATSDGSVNVGMRDLGIAFENTKCGSRTSRVCSRAIGKNRIGTRVLKKVRYQFIPLLTCEFHRGALVALKVQISPISRGDYSAVQYREGRRRRGQRHNTM